MRPGPLPAVVPVVAVVLLALVVAVVVAVSTGAGDVMPQRADDAQRAALEAAGLRR